MESPKPMLTRSTKRRSGGTGPSYHRTMSPDTQIDIWDWGHTIEQEQGWDQGVVDGDVNPEVGLR